jgi:Arc/MetJ family transcription regulator
MRTNIDLDDELMHQALRATGERTKRAVVHRALRLLVDSAAQTGVRGLKGKVHWIGNLDESRRDRIGKR